MVSKEVGTLVFLDTETTNKNPHKADLLGVSFSQNGKQPQFVTSRLTVPWNKTDKYVLHNAKYDAVVLHRQGIDIIDQIHYDTMVAYYLLHIDRSPKMETICEEVFKWKKKDLLAVYNECTGHDRKSLPEDWYNHVPTERLSVYACEDITATQRIYEYTKAELAKRPELEDWFYNIEMPLVRQFVRTELQGVLLDVNKTNEMSQNIIKRNTARKSKLLFLAGDPDINLGSPKQLVTLMYDKWQLPCPGKTKKGNRAAGKDELEILAKQHAFPKLLIDYREEEKLLSSFTEPLVTQTDDEGRIHCTFSQCLTKTRRLSCSDPNLQNIPVRSKLGKELRSCFIARPGYKFFIGDYDQVELRILAHKSQDPGMLEAFRTGVDVHTQTAEFMSKRLGREFTRADGKILNFSIVYGKTAYGFALDWGCSEKEAQSILDVFLEVRPGVKQYIEDQKLSAYLNKGWVYSLAGLPLYVGDMFTSNKWLKQKAERKAVNYPIQSSSQDIIKTAKVNIMKNTGYVPVLEVHDELVYEIPENVAEDYLRVFTNVMESAWELSVPLKAGTKISDYWEK